MQKFNTIDTLDAIKMSIQSESDMKEFYEKAAVLVQSNQEALAIFTSLSEKTEKRRQKLVRLYSKICGKKILYLNLGKKHKLSTLIRCGNDPNEAIDLAKKNETELRSFYIAVSRRLIESALRQLFREFTLERDQHLALLESSFTEPITLNKDGKSDDSKLVNKFAAV